MVADRDVKGAEAVAKEVQSKYGREVADFTSIDIRNRAAIRAALDATILPLRRHRHPHQHRRALPVLA